MRPSEFTYHRPGSLEEAVGLLGEEVRPLAGGHSLIPAMKLRLAMPQSLVDLSGVPGLDEISVDGNTLRIGAMTAHATVASSGKVVGSVPVLAEAAALIGDRQVRQRGTIGGSVAHADPAADYPTVLVALDATIAVIGREGAREIPAREFFTGLFATALGPAELVTAVHVPIRPGTGAAYEKHKSPRSGYAVVGVAATYGGGAPPELVVGGVTGMPLRAAEAAAKVTGDPDSVAAAAAAVAEAIGEAAIGDSYASGEYRSHLAT
ncbi:MAG TPA: xanthine dehydrogenase family protein subunit M, partial [Gaiellales bacterium]|nr:xanthine dehydrogenase family protein subunit M [Gaiellales bacterium]